MPNIAQISKEIRKDILNASFQSGACHIGSALSCVDILVDLFWNILKPKDVFVFSKASGASAYYAVLAKKRYFPKSKLAHYLKLYPLASKEVPGVEFSVGSLGHGLPYAVGLALADRKRKVYVLISDAEVQEGTFWESVIFKEHHKLNNLKIIVDRNGFQACGKTRDILRIHWDMVEEFDVDVINTIKGNGVSSMENNNEWHYRNISKQELDSALKELC